MSFSNYTAQAVLNSLLGKTSAFGALASAPSVHVALSTTAPSEDGTNVTEPSGSGYARVSAAASDWGSATDADPSEISNSADVEFPQATGAWGEVTHFALYDAATGGNMLASGELSTSKSPTDGDTPKFAAGSLTITLD